MKISYYLPCGEVEPYYMLQPDIIIPSRSSKVEIYDKNKQECTLYIVIDVKYKFVKNYNFSDLEIDAIEIYLEKV